jgi:hypothetical protein
MSLCPRMTLCSTHGGCGKVPRGSKRAAPYTTDIKPPGGQDMWGRIAGQPDIGIPKVLL